MRFHQRSILPLLAALLLPAGLSAQAGSPPAADPVDVSSLDAIMTAVYDVISGPSGEQRDWDRFRSLFQPGARLIPTRRDAQTGQIGLIMLTPDEFVAQAGANMEQNGFFEREIGRTVERFGPVVHVMSAYDSRRNADDPEPFVRGVNSFQLLDDGTRWWVVSIFWASETPDNPIPAQLLRR